MTILYIHGMGGGADSRIPGRLREFLPDDKVVCRTYDFDPGIAHKQVGRWFREVQPDLIIGESLGSIHALAIDGVPELFVSPAINAPWYLSLLAAPLSLIPGVSWLLGRIYRPRPGERQTLAFTFRRLRPWLHYRKMAKMIATHSEQPHFAFIGTRDSYRRSGIVSLRRWRRWFGENSWQLYEGSHFMEEEFLVKYLVPKIKELAE